ncbi:MAG: hypothetical protein JRJ12_07235 [Deltaproteobacteria bacterium]|nr:hypothetical protein [Deltaproteobacteria bacterium]
MNRKITEITTSKDGETMLAHRLDSCPFFFNRQCPYQAKMERAYLIPGLLTASERADCGQKCMSCSRYKKRPRYGSSRLRIVPDE